MANGKQTDKIALEEAILAPYNHLLQVRGKELQGKIGRSFNYWLKIPDVQLQKVFDVLTMMHNASLLLDDIQDNSLTRRGLPSAHCVYGVPLTVNASVQILVKAAQEALQLVPSREYTENKSYCEDLAEGKFSFPIIHAIHTHKEDNQVLHILRQRTRDVEVKRYCISLLEKLGSFEYTRDKLGQLDKEAREEVKRLGGNPHLEDLLDDLLSWRRVN